MEKESGQSVQKNVSSETNKFLFLHAPEKRIWALLSHFPSRPVVSEPFIPDLTLNLPAEHC
jgi:hypothetical protein